LGDCDQACKSATLLLLARCPAKRLIIYDTYK
jgi:hypothetical protein